MSNPIAASSDSCRSLRTGGRFSGIQLVIGLLAVILGSLSQRPVDAAQLLAGVGKVDITSPEAGPVNGPLHARALVLKSDDTTAAIVTLDVVSLGEIGHISNEFLGRLRARIENQLHIESANIVVNTSHCHGVPCQDVEARTFQAVQQAAENLVPVKIGAGTGHEDRIQENRRLKLTNGTEVDIRRAYSLPADDEVAAVGPIDPMIGLLRLDREDGRTLAVVYNFACHPIQGVPSGANTADLTGFASAVIEDNLSTGTVALFIQGCAGDINPAVYKRIDAPSDAESLGNTLGLSTLKAVRKIMTKDDGRLQVLNEQIALPRSDLAQRIASMEAERTKLVDALGGTFLNLKSFLPLAVKYSLDGEFPSYYSQRYLHEEAQGQENLRKLDVQNRSRMQRYVRNIHTMERISRINTNLRLLRKHQRRLVDSGRRTIDVELVGMRVGDFVLTTFPGELTVQIGLNIKQASPHPLTFVAGYTNGYIYYSPTAEQLRNVGNAQEDSDCLLAPEWQAIYEAKVAEMLGRL